MRFGIEHFRRLAPTTMGTLAWQLNDCWPVQSWAWVDSALRPKAVWYAARRFYAPLLVSLTTADGALQCTVVNDGVAEVGELVVTVVAAGGASLVEWRSMLTVGRGDNVVALDVALPPEVAAAATSSIVHATFAEAEATLLLAEPKDLDLPEPDIDSSKRRGRPTGQRRVRPSLRLSVEGDPDARWSDNYFDLLPGVAPRYS